jgi:DNA-directed RNA polymerase
MDVIPDIDSTHATLYPSTGVIDNISTISICLRRPDQVPRAYLIFRQLLQDSKTGVRRMPDTEIWAKVVQGMASLGKEPDASVQEEGQQSGRHRARSSAGGSDAAKWRDRTRSVIDAWESAFKGTSRGELPGREREGIKVYQGWFAGMVE